MSAAILPQGKAWAEREGMRAGREWEAEAAQEGKAADTSTEAASGLRGEAVSFGERESRDRMLLSLGTSLQVSKRGVKGGNQKAAPLL